MLDDECEILFLRFDNRESSVGDGEPSRFVHTFAGRAFLYLEEDDAEAEVGTFSAIYIDVVGTVIEDELVFVVFDTSQATIGYYEDLYDHPSGDQAGHREGGVRRRLHLDVELAGPRSTHHLSGVSGSLSWTQDSSRAHPLPEDGRGPGSDQAFPLATRGALLRRSRSGRERRLSLDGFAPDQKRATAALCRYYRRLGFRRVPKTSYIGTRSCESLRRQPQAAGRPQGYSPRKSGRSSTLLLLHIAGRRTQTLGLHSGRPWEHEGCGVEDAPCVCNPHGDVQRPEIYLEECGDNEPIQSVRRALLQQAPSTPLLVGEIKGQPRAKCQGLAGFVRLSVFFDDCGGCL